MVYLQQYDVLGDFCAFVARHESRGHDVSQDEGDGDLGFRLGRGIQEYSSHAARTVGGVACGLLFSLKGFAVENVGDIVLEGFVKHSF